MKRFSILFLLLCIVAHAQFGTYFNNDALSSIDAHSVVILDTGVDRGIQTTTNEADSTVIGVAYEDISASASGTIMLPGSVTEVLTIGDIDIGDYLITSTTAGYARAATTDELSAAFALAVTDYTETGTYILSGEYTFDEETAVTITGDTNIGVPIAQEGEGEPVEGEPVESAVRYIYEDSVTITIAPPVDTEYWLVEETIPAGIDVSNITGPSGTYSSTTRIITWTIDDDDSTYDLTYDIEASTSSVTAVLFVPMANQYAVDNVPTAENDFIVADSTPEWQTATLSDVMALIASSDELALTVPTTTGEVLTWCDSGEGEGEGWQTSETIVPEIPVLEVETTLNLPNAVIDFIGYDAPVEGEGEYEHWRIKQSALGGDLVLQKYEIGTGYVTRATITESGVEAALVAGDITADSLAMNEGEGYIYPVAGTTANPSIVWEEGEGESDGISHSSDSIDFIIDSTEVVTIEADGLHGDLTGDVTGDSSGTHSGDVTGGDITSDSVAMNEGESYIYPVAGTSANPAIVWEEGEGESDGIAHSTDSIDLIIDSTEVVTVEADGLHGDLTGDVTGDVLGDVTGNLTGDSAGTHTGAVSFPAGSAAAPSIYPTGDTNTGFYSGVADTLYAATNGVLRLTIYDSYIASTVPVYAAAGSVAVPSLTSTGDPDTGLFWPTSNQLGFTTAGNLQATLTSTYMLFEDFLYVKGGNTATTPNYQTGTTGVAGLYGAADGTTLGLSILGTATWGYGAGADTRDYSGGEYNLTLTNYYEAADHNQITIRGARGTSGVPDYLDDGDTVGSIKFEARDGAGTWGDAAEIRVEAIEDHASGETGSKLSIYASELDTDTQQHIASFEMCRLLPGVLNLDLGITDMRGMYPKTLGGDWAFGYIGDIAAPVDLTAYTGVTITQFSNAYIGLMLGLDGGVYFGDGSTSCLSDDTWRWIGDGSKRISIQQYDSGGTTWTEMFGVDASGVDIAGTAIVASDITVTSGDLNLTDGDVMASADDAFYLGAKDTDGSWRIIRSGDDLLHQRRESGSWVTKQTIED